MKKLVCLLVAILSLVCVEAQITTASLRGVVKNQSNDVLVGATVVLSHPVIEADDRPQTKLDRMTENGMAISIGRLRPDTQYDYKFVCLSHNTLRGAAGGAVLLAELLCADGYL